MVPLDIRDIRFPATATMCILHRFRDIITYFPKFKEVTLP